MSALEVHPRHKHVGIQIRGKVWGPCPDSAIEQGNLNKRLTAGPKRLVFTTNLALSFDERRVYGILDAEIIVLRFHLVGYQSYRFAPVSRHGTGRALCGKFNESTDQISGIDKPTPHAQTQTLIRHNLAEKHTGGDRQRKGCTHRCPSSRRWKKLLSGQNFD